MNKLLMTPEHPDWESFCERLEGPEGCDFQKDANEHITWNCGGGRDRSKSRAILETIPNIDVEGSLKYFYEHGGHCDCEVLFNVNPS